MLLHSAGFINCFIFFRWQHILWQKAHFQEAEGKVHPLKEASEIQNAIYTIYTLFFEVCEKVIKVGRISA